MAALDDGAPVATLQSPLHSAALWNRVDEVKAMLEEYGIGYSLVELDMREDGQGIAKQLGHGSFSPKANLVAKAVGAVSVVPAVFVRGSPVSRGALSQSYKSGELEHWASDDQSESDASSESVPLLA